MGPSGHQLGLNGREDSREGRGDALFDLLAGEAQDPEPELLEHLLARLISLRGLVMNGPVDLNDQSAFGAMEVDDESADRLLPAELEAPEVVQSMLTLLGIRRPRKGGILKDPERVGQFRPAAGSRPLVGIGGDGSALRLSCSYER